MRIRHYTPSDFRSVLDLHQRAVHQGCASYCSPAQLATWAPSPPNVVKWTASLASGLTWVAVDDDGERIGFVQISREGRLGHLYVDPDRARRGCGSLLLRKALNWAAEERIAAVRASVPAWVRPFFESQGFFQLPDHDESAHRSGAATMATSPMVKSLLATASAN